MKKWNPFRIIGVVGALILIVFGSIGNFVRTMKFGLAKLSQKDE